MSTDPTFSHLLDKRFSELNQKNKLTKEEKAELKALQCHYDKSPAVVHRIRLLSAKLAESSGWARFKQRYTRKFKQNMAELEALRQYGSSKAAWEIAYLHRKKASQNLMPREVQELNYLMLYHDSPAVLEITRLKLREDAHELTLDETRQLADLQRNSYNSLPVQVLSVLWPKQPTTDWTQLN